MQQPKILFISHTFPPIVGGVETQNYELSFWLSQSAEVKIIANKKRWMLPFFLCYMPLKALFLAPKYDLVLLGSGILGNVCWFLKKFSSKPVMIVTHGLDLTWKNKLYQNLWVKHFIPSADKLIAVGNETIIAGTARGIAPDKFVFIPNGTDTDKNLVEASRQDMAAIIGKSVENKKVLLTTGRLAKRKGVAWFIENVLPQLSEEYIYVIAGSGPDKENIEAAIEKTHAQGRVIMLGYIIDEKRNVLWNSADLFVQPNIQLAGDIEGFGISVIESGSCSLPVLASNLEGLKDAIKDGKNGFLVEAGNAQAYLEKIAELFAHGSPRQTYGKQVCQYVVENYQWKNIVKLYLAEISKLISQ